jgi:xylan 1,4-beta-xylosidase
MSDIPNDTQLIHNPILPGFNPDPSIIRVGADYYIATSTFEWYPGVQIHHSRDLVNWRLVTRPLTRAAQLDMRGEADSCGVWAPCLTYADGIYWLIYTDMKRRDGGFKDAHNYLVTAPAIEGPWSDPVYLNSSGFDPSLFHDDDGRKWLVNQIWDPRGRPTRFAGIVCQEYSVAEKKLVGERVNIYPGSPLGLVEGPHLYKRAGWYHLLVAEGGTSYNHAVTMARSKNLFGPYETHPDQHVVTSRFAGDAKLQRAGHGDLVETPDGEWYMVHLAGRPIPGLRRSPRGRETAIQKVEWCADGWLRLVGERYTPQDVVPGPNVAPHPFPAEPARTTFAPGPLPPAFQWLRTPDWQRLFSLDARPGFLRLYGRESVGSWYEQALVARRQTALAYIAETEVHAAPSHYQETAGLIAYYNRYSYHYLALTHDDAVGTCLQIWSCRGDWPAGLMTLPLDKPVPVPAGKAIRMKVEVDSTALSFSYAVGDGAWTRIGPVLDASVLSDEAGQGDHGCFTGAFVGMAANDLSGRAMPADFAYFDYKNV